MDIIENEIKNHQILGVRNGPRVTFGTNILAVTGLEIIILNKMYTHTLVQNWFLKVIFLSAK